MKRNLIIALCAAVLWMSAASAGAITYKSDLETEESVVFPEQTAPPASPPAGQHKLYFKDDGNLYQLNAGGNENPVLRGGFKNAIINGGFRIWQRGTSFTSTAYTADRWLFTEGSGAAVTVSRQAFTPGQTDVPGEPRWFVQLDRTTAGTSSTRLQQRMEGVRTFAGQTVTVSFYAKATAALDLIIDMQQNFGSGGSPSASVDTTDEVVSLTTAWQRFTVQVAVPSISGKTIGTDGTDYLQLRLFWPPANGPEETIFIARVQVEKGATATAFERRPIGQELALCQRYYEKSYVFNVDPGTATAVGSSLVRIYGNSNGTVARQSIKFAVPKRRNPTMQYWDINGTASQVTIDAATHEAPAVNSPVQEPSRNNFHANFNTTTSGAQARWHWTADAEL